MENIENHIKQLLNKNEKLDSLITDLLEEKTQIVSDLSKYCQKNSSNNITEIPTIKDKINYKKDFEQSLLSSNVVEFYLSKSAQELEKIFDSNVSAMINYDQNNPHHCYDLFEHTLNVVENIDTSDLSEDEILLLKIAAFFHDIGKPNVAVKKSDRTTYHGHPQESAKLALPILTKLGYSSDKINKILFFIAHHDDFKDLKDFSSNTHISKYNKQLNIENLTDIIFENERISLTEGTYLPTLHDYKLLITLCISDVTSQSRVATLNNVILDTRSNKISKLKEIEKILPKAYEKANKKSISQLQKNMENDTGIKSSVINYSKIILAGSKFTTSIPKSIQQKDDKIAISELENILNIYGFKSNNFSEKLTFHLNNGKTHSEVINYMSILASRQNSFTINSINNIYKTGDLNKILK